MSHDTLTNDIFPNDLWHESRTYLSITNLPEGRGPINGVVDLKAMSRAEFPALNAQISIFEGGWKPNDRQFIGPHDDRVTEFSLVYDNSRIVGFNFAMSPKPAHDGPCILGFDSASGIRRYYCVVQREPW